MSLPLGGLKGDGLAPAVAALSSGNASVVEVLFEHGVSPLVRDASGSTLLHIAVKQVARLCVEAPPGGTAAAAWPARHVRCLQTVCEAAKSRCMPGAAMTEFAQFIEGWDGDGGGVGAVGEQELGDAL